MKIQTILLGLWVTALPVSAQVNDTELADPNPASAAPWQNVKRFTLGWGSSDVRYQRNAVPQLQKTLSLYAWKGERVGAQAVVLAPEGGKISFDVSDLRNGKSVIPSSQIKKYFVRYAMADAFKDHQGKGSCGARNREDYDSMLVADRLDPQASLQVEAQTLRPIWLDVKVPASAQSGSYKGTLTVSLNGAKASLPFVVQVGKRTLPEPSAWKFHLDLWQNPYSVARYYGVPLWSKEHFDLMRPLMKELAQVGQKVITCSVIQHPWNCQTEDPFESMVGKKKKWDGTWEYDYRVFDKWVQFMLDCGITEQIDCYTLVPWHFNFEYFDEHTNCTQILNCKPGSKEYADFLTPFLKDFAKHLKMKGWFEKTCIAMDERPMEMLRAAHEVLHNADAGFRIEGAADYYPEVEPKMYDLSVTYQHPLLDGDVLQARRESGKRVTFYTCCGPEKPNTFLCSDPAESAFMGWHAMAAGYDGYLRWAYNSWVSQPNQDARFRTWCAGDCFLVYPGGSSIRMQKLVQGIQDFEKIRILKQEATGKKKDVLNQTLQKFRPNKFGEGNAAEMVQYGEKILRSLE